MKVFKAVGIFLCVIGLIVIGKISWYLIYSATSVTCLESKPEDTYDFGKALAINDDYIAVGDPQANRVAVYSYSEVDKKWSRTQEIYPPNNSIIDRVGSGFGSSLVLNQDQLIIGAYSKPKTSTFDDDVESNKYKLANEYHGAVYSLQLDKDDQNSLKEIVLPNSIKLTGYSLTTFNNQIALGGTTGKEPGQKLGKIFVVNPVTLQVETTIDPPSSERKFADFGFVIDGNNDFLLVGSRGLTQQGGALLIDKTGKIEEISSVKDPMSPILRTGFSVVLIDNFMAVGSSYGSEAENTLLLKPNSKGWSLLDAVSFGGSLDATESHLLISSDKRYGMPTGIPYRRVHTLVKLDEYQTKIKSEIRWKWGTDFKYSGKGIIHNDHLLLSHKGKVVLVSMKNLPSSYVINQSFCKEK